MTQKLLRRVFVKKSWSVFQPPVQRPTRSSVIMTVFVYRLVAVALIERRVRPKKRVSDVRGLSTSGNPRARICVELGAAGVMSSGGAEFWHEPAPVAPVLVQNRAL